MNFADRLIAAVRAKQTPVLVGLDPRAESLPAGMLTAKDIVSTAKAYEVFCRGVIDVVAPLVPAVKPQAAFFEQLGPAGCVALGEVVRYAASKGLLVIMDGKRNDIGTTAQAYAEAYLGPGDLSPWGADALTVSPYLGEDSITPFLQTSKDHGAGIFVLVKTSNPGGGRFQDLVADDLPLYRHVAQYVEQLSAATLGENGYGIVGAVAGATYPQQLAELRAAMPHTWLLIPGYGAQGGTAADCAAAFDERGLGAVVNNSRGIIFAHQRDAYREKFGSARWQGAVEAATREMIDQLAAATSAGKLRS
ncbi:Orotidine 5'-phosphate decarboxylase [Anatilimnocola aggregata]|uniref:Orotidine 5'-phosphate decarboxylase n=1 Tax=Anatilimnocola aggregata TaxID=2528021 RepID=A0A517Y764_9BACT|nr:orotidine-5'-phosphate decarboxylase [Anatilimnocola aggregata]QDU26071.1 Orotidine 5'-phosphate decarboxylase [Anatilimnocola aggregata]